MNYLLITDLELIVEEISSILMCFMRFRNFFFFWLLCFFLKKKNYFSDKIKDRGGELPLGVIIRSSFCTTTKMVRSFTISWMGNVPASRWWIFCRMSKSLPIITTRRGAECHPSQFG